MAMQTETLFTSDLSGRLLYVNEPFDPTGNPAPLVFVGQSDDSAVCRFRHDIPLELCDELEQLVERYRAHAVAEPPSLRDRLRLRIEMAGLRIGRVFEGPAYYFPHDPKQDHECVVVDASRANLMRKHLGDLIPELDANEPCIVMIVDGDAVSVCRTVRRSSHAAEAGVFTADGYRGRGFAPRVVGHWASITSTLGLMPLYSTSWDNHASQRVAAKLGLVQYGTDLSLIEYRPQGHP